MHALAARLSRFAQIEHIAERAKPRLLSELALRGGEYFFAWFHLTFGNAPGAEILPPPEWSARMRQQYLQRVDMPIEQNSCTEA